MIYPATAISLLYGFFNMVIPVSVFTAVLVPFQIFTLLTAVYLLYIIIRAALNHTDGAPIFLIGFFVFVLVVVRDILIANRAIDGVFLAHFGILGIIAAMGLIVVRRFSHAFSNVEAVAKNLEKINTSLVRFVPNEFLTFLGKKSITEICLGDNIRQDMCVMFIYLGIEMPLDEKASRLNMLEMFNHTLVLVNPVIQKYNGFVDKYLAEGILVLFPDDPRNAVLCALEIQSVLEQYNIRRDAQSLPHIQYAAGIHRGSLMIGTIGEDERMDSTVVSDVVNISSRLQKFAVSKKITVVISAEVAVPLGGADPCQCILLPHGEVKLRGKDQMVSLFEVRRK